MSAIYRIRISIDLSSVNMWMRKQRKYEEIQRKTVKDRKPRNFDMKLSLRDRPKLNFDKLYVKKESLAN